MQVSILGPLEVSAADGNLIAVSGSRLRTVLVRLALETGRPVSAPALVEAVWSDQPPADTANALQTLMSRLRRTLGSAARVEQSAAGYRLVLEPDDLDANRFEQLAAVGSRALRAGDLATAATTLRAALALWRGPALADVGETLGTAAGRFTDLRLATLLDRLTVDIALGDSELIVAELETLAGEWPLNERIAGQLITALAQAGRQAEALRAYDVVRTRLGDELGIDPSRELQAVHVAVLRGELAIGPSASEPSTDPSKTGPSSTGPAAENLSRRTNLKAQLTSFVGRADEVAALNEALRHNRLVTIVGPGGAGKTRLASELGALLSARDGVWLAELAPLTDGGDVAGAVLSALGLRDKHLLDRNPARSTVDADERLVEVLADKAAVVVLDNCEHVIDASARLAALLLEQCPELRIMATSREPLGIIGEVVRAVPPLGQPDADADVAVALTYPAVCLFADRAAAARADFVVDEHSVATVIEIVRRLDGLPLAIELAAARLRTMPAGDIAARLNDRFRLLTGGSRIALPRHRTLRAVVEWSWELLTEPERLLVQRLAICSAGVVSESAAAIGADVLVPLDDIPELLASLVEKSLLQRVGNSNRVRMLETIREYGIERLAERGELFEIRSRHANYFAALLHEAQPHLISAGQLPWFDRLATERDNIVAALRFRCDTGAADAALRIAIGLGCFAMVSGRQRDITSWMADALAVPGGRNEGLRWTARAMSALYAATDEVRAAEGMDELRVIAQNLDRIPADAHPLIATLRPTVAYFAGDLDLATRLLAETVNSDDDWTRAAALMFRANLAENDGNVAQMRADVDVALAEFRRIGERWGLANALRSKGYADALAGDLDAAEAQHLEALELMTQLDSRDDEAFLLLRIADLADRRGDQERAREFLQRAAVSAEQVGSVVEVVMTLSLFAEHEYRAGAIDRAHELYDEAARRFGALPADHPTFGYDHGRTMLLDLAARLAVVDGKLDAAIELVGDAYAAAVSTKDLPIIASVGVLIAELAAAAGRYRDAAELLGAAAGLRGADDATSMDVRRLRSLLLAAVGDVEFAELYATGKALGKTEALRRLDPALALASDQSRRP